MDSNSDVSQKSTHSSGQSLYVVRSVRHIVGSFFLIAGSCLFCLICFVNYSQASMDEKSGWGAALVGCIIATLLLILRLRAIIGGICFDLDKGLMTFPGGSMSFNGCGDFLNPKMLFQYFCRLTIKLDDIRTISAGSNFQGGEHPRFWYWMRVTGSFGSAKLQFRSNEGKRDEAYSFIRQYNRMGDPIIFE